MFKKFLSVLLIVTLLICNTGTIAFAETVATYSADATSVTVVAQGSLEYGAVWKLYSDGTISFESCSSIPDYSESKRAPWYSYRNQIKKISWDYGYSKEIGAYAFYGCANLTEVKLEDVSKVGKYAFSGCTSLEKAYLLNESAVTIDQYAFNNCTAINEVAIPQGGRLQSYAFNNCSALEKVYIITAFQGNNLSVYTNAFAGVTATMLAGKGAISDSWVTSAPSSWGGTIDCQIVDYGICGKNAVWKFDEETKTLMISGSGICYGIDDGRGHPWYGYADQIEKIVIDEGITTIPRYNFEKLNSLKSVEISNTVEKLSFIGFYNCPNLNNIIIPNSVKSFSNSADYLTYGTDIYYLGTEEEWNQIENVSAAERTSGGDAINIHFLEYHDGAEATCTEDGFEPYYTFGESSVYDYYYDIDKNKIDAPVVIESKGHDYGEWIIDEEAVVGKEGSRHRICNKCSHTETVSYEMDYFGTGKCGDNLTWTLYTDGTLYIAGTGDMYDYEYVNNYTGTSAPWDAYDYNFNIKKLALPEGITHIGNCAFAGYYKTPGSLIIPESVTTIGRSAFENCLGFTGTLTLPKDLKEIGPAAFHGCGGFTGELVLPEGLTEINNGIFRDCKGFTGDLVIPEGVTYINNYAFDGCLGFDGNLSIPSTVEMIGDYAFRRCSGFTCDLMLPEGLESIDQYAFYDCYGFTGEVTIPESVNFIGSNAFNNFGHYEKGITVNVLCTEATIEADAFYNQDANLYRIPAGAESLIQYAIDNGLNYELINADFAGGDGTKENPYQISTKEHLNNVRKYLDAHFIMINDITFTDEDFAEGGSFYNGGKGWEPIGTYSAPFAGSFDGNDHEISGLTIKSSDRWIGLFGYSNGDIYNIGIVDSKIQVDYTSYGDSMVGAIVGLTYGTVSNCYSSAQIDVKGDFYWCCVGGIAGYLEDGAAVNNCVNEGKISVEIKGQANTGGIVGSVENGNIIKCQNTGKVSSISNGSFANAGGITGSTYGGIVSQCFNEGKISCISNGKTSVGCNAWAGGIAGYLQSSGSNTSYAENCYNTGEVNAKNNNNPAISGGIAGLLDNASVKYCYNIGNITAESSDNKTYSGPITGTSNGTNCYYLDSTGSDSVYSLTPNEMRKELSYGGFDFENIWEFSSDTVYTLPVLKTLDRPNSINIGAQTIEGICEQIYTGSAIVLDIVIKNNNTILVEDVDYTIEYFNNKEIGTAEVIIKGIGDYTGTVEKNFVIRLLQITGVSAEGYSGVYDGDAHSITVTAPEGTTVTYSTSQNGVYSETKPTLTNVGTLTVYYKVEKDGYKTVTGSAMVQITPAGLLGVTAENYEGYYDGNPHSITVTAPEGTTITYSTSLNGEYTVDNPSFTEVGTYTVYYKATKDNYIAVDGSAIVTILQDPNVMDMGKCGDNLTWTLYKDGTLEISGTGDMYDGNSPWSVYNDKLTKLVLEEGVTRIGSSAFAGCTSLTGNLVLPNSLKVIGGHAFRECSGLTGTLVLPDGLTEIGELAFYSCNSFAGDLIIPDSVTSIGEHAFAFCKGFDGNLVLSKGLTVIEESVFFACSGFSGNLIIPEGVTTIKDCAFHSCSGFNGNLIIPETVTTIGGSAFFLCTNLTGELNIPKGIETVEGLAFGYLKKVTGDLVIPEGVKNIKLQAFYGCENLDGNLVLPNSLETIGEQAFYNCKGLTGNLLIPESVSEIGSNAFMGTNLTMQVEYEATNMEYLVQYAKGNGCKYKIIGISAEGYEGTIDGNYHSIKVNAPSGTNILYSKQQNGEYSITKPMFKLPGIYTVYYKVLKDGNELISDYATVNIEDPDVIDMGECGADLRWYVYKDGTLIICGSGEMYDYSSYGAPWSQHKDIITTLVLEEGITRIGDRAFSNMIGITGDLVIPSSVNSIGYAAFNGCTGLTGNLAIPDGVTDIEGWAFQGCDQLNGDLIIPESVTTIGETAFNATNLTLVVAFEAENAIYLVDYAKKEYLQYRITNISTEGYEGVYDGNPHSIMLTAPDGAIVEYATSEYGQYSEVKPEFTNVCEETVYYKIKKGSDVLFDGYETVRIIPAGLVGVAVNGYDGIYDGNVHTITVTAPEGATVTYSTSLEGEYIAEAPTLTNAGIKTVYYKVSKDNYIPVTGFATITIGQKSIDSMVASLEYESIIFDGTAKTPNVVVEGLDISNYDVIYSDNVNMGIATVIIEGKGNYTGRIVKNFNITDNIVEFAGGLGTEDNPYKISTKEHLNNVRYHLDANYILLNDIKFDTSDFEEGGLFYNDGKGWEPIGITITVNDTNERSAFKGTIDGRGYVIDGLCLSEPYKSVGLFGNLEGDVKNLGLENVDINIDYSVNDIYGDDRYLGGIAGHINGGTISNCYTTGNITVMDMDAMNYVGGIAGCIANGVIEKSYNEANINISGESWYMTAGGIVGKVKFENSIIDCYNKGNIKTMFKRNTYDVYLGGIAGEGYGTISKSYNKGDIIAEKDRYSTASIYIAGIVAQGGKIDNCYNSACLKGQGYVGGISVIESHSINNCYNSGTLSGDLVAGITISLDTDDSISNCFNVGKLVGEQCAGIVRNIYESSVSNCYSTEGKDCVLDAGYSNVVNCYLFEDLPNYTENANSTTLTSSEMKIQNSYGGFDFSDVWNMNNIDYYTLPYLKNLPKPDSIDIKLQEINNLSDNEYTGEEIKPNIEVRNGSIILVEDEDYTVTYSDNINLGKATVTITGLGNYTGTIIKTFIITEPVKHTPTKVEAKNPTMFEDGNIEYWICECGLWFYDEDCKEEIKDKNSVVLEKLAELIPDDDTGKIVIVIPEKVMDDAIDKAVDDSSNEVILSIIGSPEEVKSVDLPVASIENIIEADKALLVETPEATVVLDSNALDSLTDKAEGEEISILIDDIAVDELSSAQQEGIADYVVKSIISAEIVCKKSGEVISEDFGEGKVVVKLPFIPGDGESIEDFKVVYIDDEGNVVDIPTSYGENCLIVELKHFSEYAIVKDEPDTTKSVVSGNITSFLETDGDITIQLLDAKGAVVYSTTVDNYTVTSASKKEYTSAFSIPNVADGTYTLVVSKANHVTREYQITVDGGNITQDAKIHLKGDITGDGKVNILDVNKANLHFKKKSTLAGYELLCGDVTGDKKVNILDVNKLNLHFKNKSKLW